MRKLRRTPKYLTDMDVGGRIFNKALKSAAKKKWVLRGFITACRTVTDDLGLALLKEAAKK